MERQWRMRPGKMLSILFPVEIPASNWHDRTQTTNGARPESGVRNSQRAERSSLLGAHSTHNVHCVSFLRFPAACHCRTRKGEARWEKKVCRHIRRLWLRSLRGKPALCFSQHFLAFLCPRYLLLFTPISARRLSSSICLSRANIAARLVHRRKNWLIIHSCSANALCLIRKTATNSS